MNAGAPDRHNASQDSTRPTQPCRKLTLDLVRASRPGGCQRILWIEKRSATYKPDCHDLRDPTPQRIVGAESITPPEPNRHDLCQRNFASANRGTASAAPVHTMSARKASDLRRTFVEGGPHLASHSLDGDAIIHARARREPPLAGKKGQAGGQQRSHFRPAPRDNVDVVPTKSKYVNRRSKLPSGLLSRFLPPSRQPRLILFR